MLSQTTACGYCNIMVVLPVSQRWVIQKIKIAIDDPFFFVLKDLTRTVDLEVIKERTHVPSETTRTHEDFCTELLKRDIRCVFTGVSPEEGDGIHIIPYKRGTEV